MDMEKLHLSNLRTLEAESIHIIREVAAEFERPVMLYSVGKDSSCMVRLAQKALRGKAAQAEARDILLGRYRRVWVMVAREWVGNTPVRLEDQFGWRHGSAVLHRFPQAKVYEYRLR